MTKSFTRIFLGSTAFSAIPIAAAALLVPTAAHAQSICSGLPGDLLGCVDGLTTTATGTVSAGTNILAGPGLNATSATDLLATVTGNISTTGDNEPAVLLNTVDDLIFTLDGAIDTLGDNSDGVNLTGGTITATLGDITTAGLDSQGLQILSLTGPSTITVDTIQTAGDLSSATLLRGVGDINLDATALSTNGTDAVAIDIASDPAACVLLGTGGCDVTAAAENVTTNGFGGIGALIAAAGDTTVDIGVLRTNGDQAAGLNLSADPTVCAILGEGGCDTAFTVGNLTTVGDDSPAALVRAAGDITADVGVLETNGDRAIGLDLASDPTACIILGAGACETSFSVGQLTTQGAGAIGALVRAAGPTTGSVDVLETNGEGATGIDIAGDPTACVIVGVGVCDVGLTAGEVTTNGKKAAAVIINTVGDITTDLGLINTSGDNSPGVSLLVDPVACAAIGPGSCIINDQTDGVDTDGDNSPGTVVVGGEDPVTVDVGDTDTDGDNSPGVDVTGTGPIDVTVGTVSTDGDDSPGVIIDGADDPVQLTCGTIETFGANSPGVDIAAQGAISVDCDSVTTHGPASDGILVAGDTGPVDVTVGQVTTEGDGSDGIDVTTTTGAQTIVAGGVDVSGPGANGISATATGCADLAINATGDITSADGTAILASSLCHVSVTTQPGASVLGADAGIDATSGTGTTVTLNDSVGATDGPAINADGAAAVVNVNSGGSIIGRVDLTDADDVLNNAGLFDVIGTSDFGAGVDVITNTGIVRSVNGAGVLANCETFNNNGTVSMIDGAANDSLAICGNYVGGAGAGLGLDVSGNSGGLTADQLIVAGNAGGSTAVNLNLLPGAAVIDAEGVMIVDAGTATGSPFVLAGPTNAGLIDFALDQRGADTFLVSSPDAAIFDVGSLYTMGQEMWYQSADAHQSCAASRRNDIGVKRTTPIALCAQLYGSEDRVGDNDRSGTLFGTDLAYSDRLKTKRRGAQVELGFRAGTGLEVGVTGGYEHSRAQKLGSGTTIDAEGYNYGVYGQFATASGLYVDALVKHDTTDFRLLNGAIIPLVRPDGSSTGADLGVGWRTPKFGAIVDLNAGLSYVRTKTDDFIAGNIAFDGDKMTSLRGRLGARVGWSGHMAPFIDAKLFHEFRGDNDVRVGSGALVDSFETNARGTWGRFEAGLGGGAQGGPLLSAWADVGDVKGWGVRAGFRF